MTIQVKIVITVQKNRKIQKRDHGLILQIVKRMTPHGVKRKRSVQICLHHLFLLNIPKLQKENATKTTVYKNLKNPRYIIHEYIR